LGVKDEREKISKAMAVYIDLAFRGDGRRSFRVCDRTESSGCATAGRCVFESAFDGGGAAGVLFHILSNSGKFQSEASGSDRRFYVGGVCDNGRGLVVRDAFYGESV
jgi:hypothetical protein